MADNLRNDRNDGRRDDGRNIGKTLRCVRTRQSQEESCFMQGIGGSFGVVLCVPITVVIASLLLRAPLKNKPDQ